MSVSFTINNELYKVEPDDFAIDEPLLHFIRNQAGLTGTKYMCLEGGCGACLVTVQKSAPNSNETKSYSINACLKPVYSCDGLDITTIEGIGNRIDGYHPLQTRLPFKNGTQCGYCTPGMIMQMYSLLEEHKTNLSMLTIEKSFGGNICRCTGYRSILDTFKSFAGDADQALIDSCKDPFLNEIDIEDIGKMCPKTGNKCAGKCSMSNKPNQSYEVSFKNGQQYFKAYDIQGIFDALQNINNKPYIIMFGNSAQGVLRPNPKPQIYIDINAVAELQTNKLTSDGLIVGANVPLNNVIDILYNTSKNAGYKYCQELAKHIELIANIPVRNVGSMAGNLGHKHAHNEFPSDIFIILESCDAKLIILEKDNIQTRVSPAEFLKLNMKGKIIYNILFPKHSVDKKFKSYKIMIRAQNAHAYVNSGFLLGFDNNNRVLSARICYGGINPKFIHASETEKLLIGRELYSNETLQAALKSLSAEIIPDWVLPDASPEYRKNLAISLFYKFILATCPTNKISSRNISGGQIIERGLSSGRQTYVNNKATFPLTQSVVKIEGLAQCTGEAIYINDIPPQKNELYAAFVTAKKAQVKIGKIDPSEALAIEGVHHFFSAKDIPGKNDFTPVSMFTTDPEEIFVGVNSTVLFYDQPVGVILADTFALANYAATKVKLTYVKNVLDDNEQTEFSLTKSLNGDESNIIEKPLYCSVQDVLKNNATERIIPYKNNIEATQVGLNTTKTIKGNLEFYGQYHYSLETLTTVCIPTESGMEVYSATQFINIVQMAISRCLKIPENRLTMSVHRLGGSYGIKIYRTTQVSCACALAAYLTNRPVRFPLTIESNMTSIGKRTGATSDYTVEINDKGKIQKLINNYTHDSGSSLNEQLSAFTTPFFPNGYASETFQVNGSVALTAAPANTMMRAPGTNEGIAMMENIMEHIARATNRDPFDVRLENTPKGSPRIQLIAEFKKQIDYDKRRTQVFAFNSNNRWRKRGFAVSLMEWPAIHLDNYPVYVAIYHDDGTVVITTNGIEMGQGLNTKATQSAAYTLGIPVENVSVRPSDNLTSANGMLTGGSAASTLVCFGIKKACEELLERMKPVRKTLPTEATWLDVVGECWKKSIDLRAMYNARDADVPFYMVSGLSAAEMEVDILTGTYQVRRVDILEDAGDSINPLIDVGQVEGAFVMGMGYWLSEQLVYNKENGELLTDRTWHYKPPGANDIPIDFRVSFMKNSPNPNAGFLRTKAVGEPALALSCVTVFALRNALNSARGEAKVDDIWYQLNTGTTPEKVFLNAGNKFDQYTL